VSSPLEELRAAVGAAAVKVRDGAGGAPAQTRVERPKRAGQGDYSTNVAMLLAPAMGAPPREIAARIGDALAEELSDELTGYEIAGPGFVNLTLSDSWHRRALRSVLAAGEGFGGGGVHEPQRILVEFVSANPTGPLVAASGRHAAYGDALSRILEHHGHAVRREYYFNDAGSQIRLLGESVQARARGDAVPEGGYQGDYVRELAASIDGVQSLPTETVSARAVDLLLAQIKATLVRYGVHFDQFFSERTLHEGSPSYLDRALEIVDQAGHSYRSEGALWLRTTSFGDDKDRVLCRSDGQPTYFAADLGYLLEKRERGFDLQMVPVGADHHGYVARIKSAFAALGGDPDAVEMPILQFVHLIEGSDRAAMSKRRGEFVTLDELIDEIGVDAARFFMLQRSQDRTVDLDLELARSESSENPVYYVQYAHARIVSMIGRVEAARVTAALVHDASWGDGPLQDAERALIKALVDFPEEVAEAEPETVESQRIALSQAARQTIKLALWLLGVSAPDSM
jgi:arginyl-tRNA synthetase